MSSANFDDSISSLQAGFDPRPSLLQGGKQGAGAAIPEPDPNQLYANLLSCSQMEEVLVFADEDHVTRRGKAPDLSVARLRQPNLKDVLALRDFRGEELDDGDRELIIDQELHET